MSYNGSTDRFSYETQQSYHQKYKDADPERGRAILHLMAEINQAEDEIRRQNADIRRRLDYIMADLERGLADGQPPANIGEHLNRPEDLQVAIEKRRVLFRTLAMVLRRDEREELGVA